MANSGNLASVIVYKAPKFRTAVQGTTVSNVYITILDISGNGILYQLFLSKVAAGNAIMKLTIDGVSQEITMGAAGYQADFDNDMTSANTFSMGAMGVNNGLQVFFNTSLKIEYKSDDANLARIKVHYGYS